MPAYTYLRRPRIEKIPLLAKSCMQARNAHKPAVRDRYRSPCLAAATLTLASARKDQGKKMRSRRSQGNGGVVASSLALQRAGRSNAFNLFISHATLRTVRLFRLCTKRDACSVNLVSGSAPGKRSWAYRCATCAERSESRDMSVALPATACPGGGRCIVL